MEMPFAAAIHSVNMAAASVVHRIDLNRRDET
jgi:hypothetical protein